MQWPFSFVIFVELLSHSVTFSQCVDGINNVILIEDIGGGMLEKNILFAMFVILMFITIVM